MLLAFGSEPMQFTHIVHGSPNAAPSPSFYSFRDDFNYQSIQNMTSLGWTICGGGAPAGYYNASGGILRLKNDGTVGAGICWPRIPPGISNWSAETRAEWVGNWEGGINLIVETSTHTYRWAANDFGRQWVLYRDEKFVWALYGYQPVLNAWHTLRIDLKEGNITAYFDGTSMATYQENDPGTYLKSIDLFATWESYDNFDYAKVSQLVPTTPDFVVTPSVTVQNATLGSDAAFPVNISSVNSFHGQISITSDSSNSSLLPASGDPSPVKLLSNSVNTTTIRVSTSNAVGGPNWARLTFTSGTLVHRIDLQVNVLPPPPGQDFTIESLQPSQTIIQRNDSSWPDAQFHLRLTSVGGFRGGVRLYTSPVWTAGTASVSPSIVSLAANSTADAMLIVSQNSTGFGMTVSFRVTAATFGLDHWTEVQVHYEAAGFTLALSRGTIVVNPGESGTVKITLTSFAFSGTVSLNFSIGPVVLGGPVASLEPDLLYLTSNGTAQAALTITTTPGTPGQTYTVYIYDYGGRQANSTILTLIVPLHPYLPGVRVGTTATYTLSSTSTLIPPFSLALTVTGIDGTNVSYRVDLYSENVYLNTTESWSDVATGEFSFPPLLPFVLVSDNLATGDSAYLSSIFQALRITSTEQFNSAGVSRTVVRADIQSPYGPLSYQIRWDKTTGMLVDLQATLPANYTTINIHYSLQQTSAWSQLATAFTETPAGNPSTLAFTASVSGGESPYMYSWNFGDGTGSSLVNPIHTYTGPGNYAVVLTVTDSSGTSRSSTQTVRIQGSQAPTSNIRTMITTLVSGLTPVGIVLQLILAAIAGVR